MTRNYPELRESVRERVLPNGLRVCYIPKDGFSKTFAILATDFGSVDASFTFEGQRFDTPAGVAHFLEHKMFEDEDGNALQKFARTGASPNAFTSHTMTAYHFSCTERFEENLEILLKFVFTPYFTEGNVAKERGIIGQEIRMVEDTPSWQVYCGLFRALYREHPVRVSIPGSEESIARITPELLYTCHRAFYSPKNMALVVCGTADFEQVCRMAEQLSPADAPEIGERHYGTRRKSVSEPTVTQFMQVSRPQFLVGFKDAPVQPGESRLKRMLTGELAVRRQLAALYRAVRKAAHRPRFRHGLRHYPGRRGGCPRRREPRPGDRARGHSRRGAASCAGRRGRSAVPPHETRDLRPAPARVRRTGRLRPSGGHGAVFRRALRGFRLAPCERDARRCADGVPPLGAAGMRRHVGRSTQITQRKRRKMEHTIGFPNLGLEFTLNRVACTVLGKDIYWYGIIICAGFILAALYVNSRTKEFGITSDNLMDCLIICVPLGIICARIYYVVFEWSYYAEHPSEIIAIWKGGIAIYGGIIGTLIGLFVYSRVKKLSFASLCDLAAFGLLIGQCIGRWGNFVNGEAHGGPTILPWGMTIDGGSMVHPTFFYESLWNLIGFILLHFYSKKRKFKGEMALLYVAWYGAGRAWIEGLRTDSLYIGPVRVSQLLAVISCLAAIAVLVRQYRRIAVSKAFYVPEVPKTEETGEK